MTAVVIFGLGYSASRIAARMRARGWAVRATGSAGDLAFGDADAVAAALAAAEVVLSSVPPVDEADPVLVAHGAALRVAAGRGAWLGYLSSTGVYGDCGGAWVDESAPLRGRRGGRMAADLAWQALGAHVFRLPGIYGPGRSAFERIAEGRAHRVDVPGQVFSRVHVDDIAGGVMAAIDAGGPGAVWNLADDLPVSQNAVIEAACALLGVAPPPLVGLDEAGLPPMARGFYGENRRVANGRAKRGLGWRLRWPTYREGLAGIVPR